MTREEYVPPPYGDAFGRPTEVILPEPLEEPRSLFHYYTHGWARNAADADVAPTLIAKHRRAVVRVFGTLAAVATGVLVYVGYESMTDDGRPVPKMPVIKHAATSTPHTSPQPQTPRVSNCTSDGRPGVLLDFNRIRREHNGIVTFGMLPDALNEQYHLGYKEDDYKKIVVMNSGMLETRHHGADKPTADTRSGLVDTQCLALPAIRP